MTSGILGRASVVLEDMRCQHGRPVTLADVTRRTGIPRSSVHRILDQLAGLGWIARAGNEYRLGSRMFDFGIGAAQGDAEMACAWPVVQGLAARTGLIACLGTIRDSQVVILEKAGGPPSTTSPFRVGARLPAQRTSLGKVLLSAAGNEAHENIDARRRDELGRVRETGVAHTFDDLVPGIGCVASVVRVHGRPADVALAVSGSSLQVRNRVFRLNVQAAAAALGRALEANATRIAPERLTSV
ncbi:helix-turn-helix domain-containing protein [Gordonia sp. PDNC005]|uniref:IclR family transcriptional regulator n=1 Tax=unclassified Gordonia (in: high G+C Gram-positive bacteria) TaxID=2657482 RepID=UPI001966A7B2|nr:IclR family transcriptional regulator C-terminal domain-containing protein [Gordonia sp. PDNC005]QRY61874.1 helix-turn-helix domain-containing protein [Gordonia sp. PDNC005]